MCVRTKTSFGCGHTYKQDQSCHHRSCDGLEKYHFENEGDCRPCKRGGDAVTRGREGQGRYARGLHKKDAVTRVPLSTISDNSHPSPWAPPSKREKDWRSPIRKRADEAWVEEHARREEDLQSRSPSSRLGGSVRSADGDSDYDQRREARESAIREELRRIEDSERVRIRRRRERKASFDSFDSYGESHRSHDSGLRSHGQHSYDSGLRGHGQHSYDSGYRGHESSRSRMYDSGFGSSKHNHHPYNVYNTEAYFSDLGHGFGDLVRDSGRRFGRW